jgi:hypothetical protein
MLSHGYTEFLYIRASVALKITKQAQPRITQISTKHGTIRVHSCNSWQNPINALSLALQNISSGFISVYPWLLKNDKQASRINTS